MSCPRCDRDVVLTIRAEGDLEAAAVERLVRPGVDYCRVECGGELRLYVH